MEKLDDLALLHIARFLNPEDIVNLGRSCKRLYSVMPGVILSEEVWHGDNFHVFGPSGHCWPEKYFDTPELCSTVKELSLSVTWKDQGWGNKKGELFVKLMRPVSSGNPIEVAEYRQLFGIAEHYKTSPEVVIETDHPVLTEAKPGDFYRFMRNVGGGGGHSLKVKNFRARTTVPRVQWTASS